MTLTVFYDVQGGPFWDWKVAVDLFLGGTGVGALLFAVGIHRLFGERYPRIARTAAYLGPLLIVAGLLVLLLKLGKPAHLLLTYTRFAPTSPLWWGGIFQTLLVVGSVWYAAYWYRRRPVPALLEWAVAAVAVIVGAYHGLLLAVITARPLWNTGPTVVAAMLAFVTTGIAAVFLVHLGRMKLAGRLEDGEHLSGFLDDMKVFRVVLTGGLILQIGTLFLWWLSLQMGSLDDRLALAAANEAHGPLLWVGGIGIGIVLPLLIGGLAGLRQHRSAPRREVVVIAVCSFLILVGGLLFRLALVLGGQATFTVPTFS